MTKNGTVALGLGHRIATARKQAKLSQTALAKVVGLTRSAVSQWESEGTEPTPANLRAIAIGCGVDYSWIATGSGTMANAAQDPELDELIELLKDADQDIKDAVALLLRRNKGGGRPEPETLSRDRQPSNRK